MDRRYRKNKGFSAIGDVLDKVVPHHRPKMDQTMIQIWEIWESAVGVDVAAHARPAAFKGDLLLVHVSNSSMLHHMRFMEKEMIRKLNQAIGSQQVRALTFKIGPV